MVAHLIKEHDLQKTCKALHASVLMERPDETVKEALMLRVEARLVNAAWVLRRLPDREKGFLHMRSMLLPEGEREQTRYPVLDMSNFEMRKRLRISPQEIDDMQPALDLLLLLPDTVDRQVVFWACWHQEGEVQSRIPWAKVRRSTGVTMSRWTLKRRYEGALRWLASLIALQV